MKKLFAVVIITTAVMLMLTACGIYGIPDNDYSATQNEDNVNSETDDIRDSGRAIELSSSMLSSDTYKFCENESVTESDPYEIIYSFSDDTSYYYCLRVGTIKNVIVNENPCIIRYTGKANVSRTYEMSHVTKKSVAQQQTNMRYRIRRYLTLRYIPTA